jgi:hypothetical protein
MHVSRLSRLLGGVHRLLTRHETQAAGHTAVAAFCAGFGTHTMRRLKDSRNHSGGPRTYSATPIAATSTPHPLCSRTRTLLSRPNGCTRCIASDIRTAADLSRLPVLTKSDVRQHASELLRKVSPAKVSPSAHRLLVLRGQHTHIVRSCGGSSCASVTAIHVWSCMRRRYRNVSEITALL